LEKKVGRKRIKKSEFKPLHANRRATVTVGSGLHGRQSALRAAVKEKNKEVKQQKSA
jgi:hypothetical protein